MFRRKDPPLFDVKRLDIRPGDTLVFTTERRIPRDVLKKLQAQLRERFADEHVKPIILEGGLTLSHVLREEDPYEPSPH